MMSRGFVTVKRPVTTQNLIGRDIVYGCFLNRMERKYSGSNGLRILDKGRNDLHINALEKMTIQ